MVVVALPGKLLKIIEIYTIIIGEFYSVCFFK